MTSTEFAPIGAGKFKRALIGLTAAATVSGATALALPATAAAATPPRPPAITTTVDGNDVTFRLADPNSGARQALTTCSLALIDIAKAIPLLPDLATGALPPLNEIDPATFAWGPMIAATNVANRDRTWQIPDVPNGVYLAVGVCLNPATLSQPAIDIKPVLVGSTIQIGSAVLDLGSIVLDTPGALDAILDFLGIDTGSLGSGDAGS